MITILAISLTTILLILAILSDTRRRRKAVHLPPSPPALPIIGHLHLIRQPIHQSLHNLAARYGPLIHLRLGSTPCMIVSSPDMAKEFLKTHDLTFSNRPQTAATGQFAYDSASFAFAPYGDYYRFMRKLCVSELLGTRTVKRLRPVLCAELLALLRTMLAKARLREAVDVSQELIKMTNNEIMRMTVGTSPSDSEAARGLVKQVAELVGAFNLADYIGICRNLDLQGLSKRMREVHGRFDALMERIIKDKQEDRRSRRGKEEEGKDLLDMLLDVLEDGNAEMKLTKENIKGFLLDIFTAGSDTTAATIEWALAELINHPAILRKLREEIDLVVGMGRIIEASDIPSLPYLQAVIKETMRLHPAAPLSHRQSVSDVIVAGSYHIPVNTSVMINLWSIARDPKYWESPLEFRPDRFDNGEIDVRGQHFELLPFGSGRRGCPGVSLALQVMHVTLAAMVQCFEWEVLNAELEKTTMVDMEEGVGMVVARARPLVCVPVARLTPFSSVQYLLNTPQLPFSWRSDSK